MNYIKHLTAYFDFVSSDHSLNPTHISLYVAFFQFWNLNRFQNPISINRDEVMRISKICSKATYHKCIKELHEKGYIIYEPSYNPFKGSIVHMVNLSEQLKPSLKTRKAEIKNEHPIEQVLNKHCTSIGTGTEQALVPFINSINITNNKNIDKYPIQKIEIKSEDKNDASSEKANEKKLHEKKGTDEAVIPSMSSRAESTDKVQIPPLWENVLEHFKQNNHSETEAQKYFNYYSSNGWLVGGKTKMKDWKAAARNWMLNANKFQTKTFRHPEPVEGPQPNHLHIPNTKNYAEPL